MVASDYNLIVFSLRLLAVGFEVDRQLGYGVFHLALLFVDVVKCGVHVRQLNILALDGAIEDVDLPSKNSIVAGKPIALLSSFVKLGLKGCL